MFRRLGGRDERYSLKVDQTITHSRHWSEKSMVSATQFSPCYSETKKKLVADFDDRGCSTLLTNAREKSPCAIGVIHKFKINLSPQLRMGQSFERKTGAAVHLVDSTVTNCRLSWSYSARAPRVGPEFRSRRLVRRTLSLVSKTRLY